MRIAHLCLSCFYIDRFGYQENVLPRLHKRDGHDVIIVASTETYDDRGNLTYTSPGEYLNEDGIPVVRLPYRRILPQFVMRKARMHPRVEAILTEFRPDVILFHGLCGWELLTAARFARRHSGTKLFVDSHEDANNSARGFVSGMLHRLYYRPIIRGARSAMEKVLCISLETQRFVRSVYGLSEAELEFFPLGGIIPTDAEYVEARRRTRRALGVADDEIVVLQAGKMGSGKKVLETLRFFASRRSTRLRLVLVGLFYDDVRDEAMSLCAGPNVSFVGWKNADELAQHLCAADVYLQPGSQSAIMQAALCSRCAVVLDDVESHRVFVDGNGWLLNPAVTLEAVLEQIERDPHRLEGMSRRSHQLACRYLDYDRLAARIYN